MSGICEEHIMYDINKLIAAEAMPACEAGAFLSDIEDWTETDARRMARMDGLDLTDERLDVICWMRDYFADCGQPKNPRGLSHAMEAAFAEQGGRRYLYHLFPQGPVLQGCRLAGLPTPAGTVDRSFGTVH
jgi:TusE/DsrC/DsvC family sulfur relay protein